MKKGTLFLVPNTLGDEHRETQIASVIPPFVAGVAAKLDCWIVENAKTARAFLSAVHQITPLQKPLQEISMSVWRGPSKEVQAIDLMGPLLEGRDMGLMSEAGLPAIADPGTEIVAMAHHLQIPVRPLTGPNSLMLALMASGMSGQHFCFHGYLPIKAPERLKKLRSMENESKQNKSAHLWIETPYRNLSMLTGLTEALHPSTNVCMAMDLTLETEQIIRLPVAAWQKLLQSDVSTLIKNIDKRPAVFVMQA